jgi:AbrB family looped-hinge helix DNA binding protein
MAAVRTKIDKAGRILIPARLRQELGIAPGDPVIVETQGGELYVRSHKKAIEEAQVIIGK